MADWGGAQWLIVFLLAVRAFIGLAAVTGQITVRQSDAQFGKVGQYIGKRVIDGLFLATLVWGGFF